MPVFIGFRIFPADLFGREKFPYLAYLRQVFQIKQPQARTR